MILTGNEITHQVSEGRILIDPFTLTQVNPNSYDVRLGNRLLTYLPETLDAAAPNATVTSEIPANGLILQPDKVYLGHIQERMGSNHYVPHIHGKSSIGRLGLFVHITAGLVDIGSFGQWTLQLHAVQPVVVYPGMLIGQVTFWRTEGTITLYSGKYQDSTGPVPSKSFAD